MTRASLQCIWARVHKNMTLYTVYGIQNLSPFTRWGRGLGLSFREKLFLTMEREREAET